MDELGTVLQPGSKVGFMRGKEVCEGIYTVQSVDVRTNIVSLTETPAGIKHGDKLFLIEPRSN